MIRFIHFSDLHLGSDTYGKPNPETGISQRIHDFAARLDEVVDFAFEHDVGLVLFAGDAFKNSHPTPTVQTMLAERIWRLAKGGKRVFLLAGNHDLPRMVRNVTALSVYPTLEVANVVVAERAGIYTMDLGDERLQIAALPHFWRSALVSQIDETLAPRDIDRAIDRLVADKVSEVAERLSPTLPAILTAHCHVTKAQVSTAQDLYGISDFELSLSSLANRAFPYIALGHIHKPQVLAGDWRDGTFAAYSGSLERVDFGEEKETKGFYVVDMENGRLIAEPHFEPVSSRRFATVSVAPKAEDPTDEVLAAVDSAGVADAIVRVVVACDRARYGTLDQARVRAALASAYDARLQPAYEQEAVELRDPRFSDDLSYADALQEYASSEFGADAEDVVRLGREIIDEVVGS